MTGPGTVRVSSLADLPALEEAMRCSPLQSWERLLESDPYATFFQGPIWTLCWYRAYADLFDPLVIVMQVSDELVGVAPMAVEKRTRRLAFAGDHMADYRDVVALPGYRERVIRELVRQYRASRPRTALRFGSTLPESTSAQIVVDACRAEGVPAVRLSHDGWRWWPEQAEGDPFKSRSARYKLNRIKRQGEVSLSIIAGRDEWERCREAYFDQHSLRQLSRGTDVSFDKPEKRRFFDALMGTRLAHVSVLSAGDKPIAWHYGCLDRGVLYLGAPAFDLREHRQSPGLLLILLLMKDAERLGLRGIDLTIGEGDLKERYSTSRVELPTIELFPHWRAFVRRRVAQAAASAVRRTFAALGQEPLWKGRIKPVLSEAAALLANARTMSARRALRYLSATLTPLAGRPITMVFVYAGEPGPPAEPDAAATVVFGLNNATDLLKRAHIDPYTASRVRLALEAFADGQAGRADIHTMVAGGQLVAWGFSTKLDAPMPSGIDGFGFPAGAVVISGLETASDSPEGLVALMRHIVAQGVSADTPVWLLAENPERRVRDAVERAGFRLARSGKARKGPGAPAAAAADPGRRDEH
jgi:CelD/BcsL family acetyltransferase involved in cellulose biosynthesis